ncbi:hypothetical protein CDEST_03881 [Colletotrichum destructivum]|uniref:Uncharacterized protein n=1 Tax=Colletotrichum destructivum TaxID=34406 RepID=A0AAX4I649_9PEZI|nr:hypothetical protein CDEST_03881 [Colletotrichum destructivum]
MAFRPGHVSNLQLPGHEKSLFSWLAPPFWPPPHSLGNGDVPSRDIKERGFVLFCCLFLATRNRQDDASSPTLILHTHGFMPSLRVLAVDRLSLPSKSKDTR